MLFVSETVAVGEPSEAHPGEWMAARAVPLEVDEDAVGVVERGGADVDGALGGAEIVSGKVAGASVGVGADVRSRGGCAVVGTPDDPPLPGTSGPDGLGGIVGVAKAVGDVRTRVAPTAVEAATRMMNLPGAL